MLLDFIVACADCGHIADEHDNGGSFNDECNVAGCGCYGYLPDEDDYQRIATSEVTSERLTLTEAETIVGEPADAWKMRCFEIASKLADRVGGVAVYGAWDGPISPRSPFKARGLSPNHGWVLLADGTIFDPTRWVFEGLDPYLYEGENDYYDEGRNRFRSQNLPPYPASTGDTVAVPLSDTAEKHLAGLTGERGDRTGPQWMWVANLPYDTLEPHASEVYTALAGAGLAAFIPIDNRLRFEREAA